MALSPPRPHDLALAALEFSNGLLPADLFPLDGARFDKQPSNACWNGRRRSANQLY